MIYTILEWLFQFPSQVLRNNDLMSKYFTILHQTLCLAGKVKMYTNASNSNMVYMDELLSSAKTSKIMLFNYNNDILKTTSNLKRNLYVIYVYIKNKHPKKNEKRKTEKQKNRKTEKQKNKKIYVINACLFVSYFIYSLFW